MKMAFIVELDIDDNEVNNLDLTEQELKNNFEAGIPLVLQNEFGNIPINVRHFCTIRK